MSAGYLVLEDGTVFRGRSVAADGVAFGEAVFTTAMTGYQETVTDPSYAGQLVCFTAPMVGNYGVAEERGESREPHARAVLMRAARRGRLGRTGCAGTGSSGSRRSTRARSSCGCATRGAMRAAAVADEARSPCADALVQVRAQPLMEGQALVAPVSTREPYVFADPGGVASRSSTTGRSARSCAGSASGRLGDRAPAHDPCGRARRLRRRRALERAGRPRAAARRGRDRARRCSDARPILGICLGHQLLGLATGHSTFKLPFGHRGANHPVLERRTGRVLVTSQNHGFAVEPSGGGEATHVSLYDGTVEGFDFPDLRARSVQFHPEAGPGPHDAWPILGSGSRSSRR